MQYLEVTFTVSPVSETANDIIAALAAELGFESFVESEQGTIGYVPINLYDEQALNEALADFPMPDTQVTFTTCEMEDKNWNEEWEKHFFEPIVVDSRCVIHSTFHKDYPKADFDIIINPQMAFGTGHHQTTRLIISYLLDIELSGKTVLDMGCGTSILAILASMRGAKALTAIDIDEWCVNNSIDNLALNDINNIKVFQGDASSLASEGPFDVVIANINRNILLADMQYYVARMNQGGEIYFSGFYESDLPMIQAEAERLGLRYISHRVEKEWTAAQFAL
ncbi:MAG: 50S ribosomal protein L11 methyltransferase [Bacteroidaceae bacterium]|nr:50S ribosomal protein L11 methyltransferase [Bacteroidaceae bacterium]